VGPRARLRLATDGQLLTWAEAAPRDARLQRALAERLGARGESGAAIAALERAVAATAGGSRTEELETRRALVAALLRAGRGAEALRQMHAVAQQDPSDAETHAALGEFYLSRGAVAWAADAFEKVTAARPRDARAWARLGECTLSLNLTERAGGAFERARRLAPDRPEYTIGAGRAFLQSGRRDLAEAAFHSALRTSARAEAAYWLGMMRLTPGPGEVPGEAQAIRWLEEACRLDPRAPAPPLALGRLLCRREPRRAVALLKHALALAPDGTEPLYALGHAYLALGRRSEGLALLRRFALRSATERKWRHLELRLTQSPGDPALRAAALGAWRLAPGNGGRRSSRGAASVRLVRPSTRHRAPSTGSEATLLQQAVERDPASSSLHRALARLYEQQGEWRRAAAAWTMLTSLSPEDADGWFRLGGCWMRLSDEGRALDPFQRAVALAPLSAVHQRALAGALRLRGRYAEAERHCRLGLFLRPDEPEAHFELAKLLRDRDGATSEAEASLRRAVTLRPEDPVLHYYLGALLQEQGRTTSAIAEYRAALRRLEAGEPPVDTDGSESSARLAYRKGAHFNLAALLQRQGRQAEAARHQAAFRRLSEEQLRTGQLLARLAARGKGRASPLEPVGSAQ
jgi:tetratricopeptide (TPR) repeat protein